MATQFGVAQLATVVMHDSIAATTTRMCATKPRPRPRPRRRRRSSAQGQEQHNKQATGAEKEDGWVRGLFETEHAATKPMQSGQGVA